MDDFQDLEDLDPALLEQLISMGVIDDQQGILAEQIAQADYMRSAPGPEGRDSGRIYTAANPLEHVGNFMQKYAAHRDLKDLRKQQQDLLQQQTQGRQDFLDALIRRRGVAPTPEYEGYGPQGGGIV